MAKPSVDTESLVARLWEEIRAKDSAHSSLEALQAVGKEPVQYLADLRYLNHHWDFEVPDPREHGGPTVKGRAKAAVGRFLVHFLAKYFDDQREFRAHIVRVFNTMAQNYDTMAGDIAALAHALRNESQRLSDRDAALHALLEERLERIERSIAEGTTDS